MPTGRPATPPRTRTGGQPAALLAHAWRLGPEALRFGVVGLTGVALQFVVFNLLRYAGPNGAGVLYGKPVTALVLAISSAGAITYLGNRHWTYRHRERGHPARELPIFVLLNVIAISIGALCLAFSTYVLGLQSPLADNLSGNVIGLGLGTAFRFWSYRRFVFTGQARPQADPTGGDARLR